MKLLLFAVIILAIACDFYECEPGDIYQCQCGLPNNYGNYPVTCNNDRFYDECECPAGSPGPDGKTSEEEPDSIWDFFPGEEKEVKINDCRNDETNIPTTNLCVRKCPVGMELTSTGCQGVKEIGFYQHMLDKCKAIDEDYRFPSMQEVLNLLNQCHQHELSFQETNYCESYYMSPFRFIIEPIPELQWITFWTGNLETCDDRFGNEIPGCAWSTRIYMQSFASIELDYYYAYPAHGNALLSGYCIR